MRIQPLYDLQQEVNRLFIAGSKFAKNDPRLTKLIPVFEKMGEKAPVFKKLACNITELTNTEINDSSEKLINISTLLYSVLYTQGDMTETETEKKEQNPHFNIDNITTLYSYLELKPVIKALSESNQGRLEIVRDAQKRGIFKDFRTYAYLNMALGDKYSELAEYVDKIIMEETGQTMLPILLESFSYDGRPEDVRRLSLLNHFKYKGLNEMIEKIMSGSSVNLQAGAIKILSGNPANEDLIIELANDKNKVVREAAYNALASINTEKCQQKLFEVYTVARKKNKTNLELVTEAIRRSDMNFNFDKVFEEVQACFKELLDLDKDSDNKLFVAAMENLNTNIYVLSHKNRPEVYKFLTDLLTNKEYTDLIKNKKTLLSRYADYLSTAIVNVLHSLNQGEILPFLENIVKEMPNVEWKNIFVKRYMYASVAGGYSSKQVYDIFIKYFDNQTLNIDDLIRAYSKGYNYYYTNISDIEDIHTIDRRWIDKLYEKVEKQDNGYQLLKILDIIHKYEPPKSDKFNKLLKVAAKKTNINFIDSIFERIMEREVPDRFEYIFSIVKDYNSKTNNYYCNKIGGLDIWTKFPKEYIEKFKKLADKTKIQMFDDIVYKIELGNGI